MRLKRYNQPGSNIFHIVAIRFFLLVHFNSFHRKIQETCRCIMCLHLYFLFCFVTKQRSSTQSVIPLGSIKIALFAYHLQRSRKWRNMSSGINLSSALSPIFRKHDCHKVPIYGMKDGGKPSLLCFYRMMSHTNQQIELQWYIRDICKCKAYSN